MSNDLGSLVTRSVEHIGTSANWFRRALGEQHVQVQRSSAIEGALNRLDIFRGLGEFGVQVPWPREDRYEFFAEAIGADFLTKTVHRGVLRGLCLPHERWRQFVGGDPIITCAGSASQERDRAWETVLVSPPRRSPPKSGSTSLTSRVRSKVFSSVSQQSFPIRRNALWSALELAQNRRSVNPCRVWWR